MAISQVQKVSGGSALNSTTVTLPASPTAGNLLVAVHHSSGTATPAGWSIGRQVSHESGVVLTLYYKIAGASESASVTVSSVVNTNNTLSVLEYSGISTPSPLDRSICNPGVVIAGASNVTSLSTNETGRTRQDEELAVAALGLFGTSGGWNNAWTNSFTMQTQQAGGSGGSSTLSAQSVAHKILSAKDYISSTETWTLARRAGGLVCTFRGATADPPAPPLPPTFDLKYQDSSTFIESPRDFKYWNGTAWVAGLSKTWNGTEWAERATMPYENYALWSGQGYTITSDVVLTQDTLLDTSLAQIKSLTVQAGVTLAFKDDLSVRLESTENVIIAGKLKMTPASPTYIHELNFPSVNEAIFVGGGGVPLSTDVGLWFTGVGIWEANGSAKTPWTRLTGSALAGNTTISVSDAIGWQVGDEIAVAPHEPPTVPNHWLHYDEKTITSISGSGPYIIGLSAALTFPHTAVTIEGVVHTAEVMNLSRNVKISGTPTGRTHVAFFSGGHTLNYIEAKNTGPRNDPDDDGFIQNTQCRYSFHFHAVNGRTYDQVVEGCVSHLSGGHAFVGHASHGVTFRRCIAHDTFDEAFWYDIFSPGAVATDGADVPPPVDLFFDRCIASKVKVVPGFRGFRLSGFKLAHGQGNRCRDNVAIGVQGNADASGFDWAESAVSVFDFDGNTAHNNKKHGIFTWQNTSLNHIVTNSIMYWNGGAGIKHGAYVNVYEYGPGIVCYGNGESGLTLSAQNSGGFLFGPLLFTQNIFDSAGISSYAVINGEHSVIGSGNVEIRDSTFKGYTVSAIGIVTLSDEKDQVDFIDCTFSGIEDTWLFMSNTCHIDSVVFITNPNGNGLRYECHRSDYATGTFYAPWNCKRIIT